MASAAIVKNFLVLGGGCFWCLEASFRILPGVIDVTPGYSGGHDTSPDYKSVCSGSTGHAEVVKIAFESAKNAENGAELGDTVESVEEVRKRILSLFFEIHDPTTLNRQGNDVGTQYRSIIFFSDEKEKESIDAFIDEIRPSFEKEIVTEIRHFERFFPAEEYHHRYFEKNPNQGYCRAVVAKKERKARLFVEKMKTGDFL